MSKKRCEVCKKQEVRAWYKGKNVCNGCFSKFATKDKSKREKEKKENVKTI